MVVIYRRIPCVHGRMGFRAFYSLVWRIYGILLGPLFLDRSGLCWFAGSGASLCSPLHKRTFSDMVTVVKPTALGRVGTGRVSCKPAWETPKPDAVCVAPPGFPHRPTPGQSAPLQLHVRLNTRCLDALQRILLLSFQKQ